MPQIEKFAYPLNIDVTPPRRGGGGVRFYSLKDCKISMLILGD